MEIKYTKCHGSANDFILVDCISNNYSFTDQELVEFTKQVCDREKSIGADGTLFLMPSEKADARMRIFNTDGSEPEMCGNGIRCVARQAAEVLGKDEFYIETIEANLLCKKETEIFPDLPSYSVLISNVGFNSKDFSFIEGADFIDQELPVLSSACTYSAVDLGNPHIVAKSLEINDEFIKEFGENANKKNPLFPNGVNASFFKYLGEQTIFVRTFERGVGITNSCGTAMSASSIVSCLTGICEYDKWINVFNAGGMVKCFVQEENNHVTLLGNATFESEGNISFVDGIVDKVNIEMVLQNEIDTYNRFENYCKEYLNK